MLAGIPIGLTGICYYYSIKYIPVSVSVVLIMQTIWMGVVMEAKSYVYFISYPTDKGTSHHQLYSW